MQFFLNFHYPVGESFVLISCLFADQYLFENFVPMLEQLSNSYATASFGLLALSPKRHTYS